MGQDAGPADQGRLPALPGEVEAERGVPAWAASLAGAAGVRLLPPAVCPLRSLPLPGLSLVQQNWAAGRTDFSQRLKFEFI